MKNLTILLILTLAPLWMVAQNLEIVGKAKVTVMDKVNTADSVVVRLADGTLAVRDVFTILEQPPGTPVLTGSLALPMAKPTSVYVSGRYVYVLGNGGAGTAFHVIDASDPSSPSYIGMGGANMGPQSLYVSGRYAYAVAAGGIGTLSIVDISDPSSPITLGFTTKVFAPVGLHVSGHYAYTTDFLSDSLYVIDISNPSFPSLVGGLAMDANISTSPVSLYISGLYAYVGVNTGQLRIIDVSDPYSPSLAGSLTIGGFPRGICVSGRYAYVIDIISDSLKVVDVSDPSSPSLVGGLAIGSNPTSICVSGRYAFVVDSGSDDLKIIDISDPASPILQNSFGLGPEPADVFVSGRYAYVVDHTSDSLKIIDISGGEMTSLIAHSLEAGNLQVRNDIIAQGQLQVTGGLNVGAGGIYSDGNVGITGTLALANDSIPKSSPTNLVQLYAQDVANTSELRVRDEAGNVTTLSPRMKCSTTKGS